MTPERFQKIDEIFRRACELPVAERTLFVRRVCAEDADLSQRVLALLKHDERPAVRLDSPIAQAVRSYGAALVQEAVQTATLPEHIGAYRVLQQLGEGGFGVVYLAEQGNPRRTVALKVLRAAVATADTLKRFEYEAYILGRLQHPGIAQIYEAGVVGLGAQRQAFFALEYIRGRDLIAYAEAPGGSRPALRVPERLELFTKMCDALQHAHQNGVIHRDLKPENILVVEEGFEDSRMQGFEGQETPAISPANPQILKSLNPHPKILDFGVARLLDPADNPLTLVHTGEGQLIGTLSYMSPEQVGGDSRQVDTRSDVYAAGVLLYQLLTGRLPYEVRGRPLPEAVRIIAEQTPVSLGTTNRALRGDLEAIVAKALAKDKNRRYSSAAELAADIRRHLAGEPIEAKRDSALYILRKHLRRYRGLIAAASLLIILLSVFSAVAFFQAEQNARLAREANAQKERANQESQKLRRSLYSSNIGYAQAALNGNDVDRMARLLEACPEDLRGWEWRYLKRLTDRSSAYLDCPRVNPGTAALSRDGRRLVALHADDTLALYDVPGRARLLSIPTDAKLGQVAVSPDGARFVLADNRGVITVRDGATGETVLTIQHALTDRAAPDGRYVQDVQYSPDGARLASSALAGPVRIWDAHTGALLQTLNGPEGTIRLLFTLDGRGLVTVSRNAAVLRLWDLETAALIREYAGLRGQVSALALSADSAKLAAVVPGVEIKIWDFHSGAEQTHWARREVNVPALAFSPDGATLISSGSERGVQLWNAANGELLQTLRGHRSLVSYCAFTSDGREIVSAGYEGGLRWWPTALRPDVPLIRGIAETIGGTTAFSPDGTSIVIGSSHTGAFAVWDAETLQKRVDLHGLARGLSQPAFSPDGAYLYAGTMDPAVRVWDARTGHQLPLLGRHDKRVFSVACDAAGKRVASGDAGGEVKIWDMAARQELARFQAHEDIVRSIAFSPDGARLLTGGADGRVRMWDGNGRLLWEARKPDGTITEVAFDAAGRQVAAVGDNMFAQTWDAADGAPRVRFVGYRGRVNSCAFTPDGRRLVTGGSDRIIRIWDAVTGEEVLSLHGHDTVMDLVAFSADGRRLASGSDDGVVRLWEAAPERGE